MPEREDVEERFDELLDDYDPFGSLSDHDLMAAAARKRLGDSSRWKEFEDCSREELEELVREATIDEMTAFMGSGFDA